MSVKKSKKKKSFSLKKILGFLLSLLLGFGIGFILARQAKESGQGFFSYFLPLFLSLILALVIHIVFHELGHLVFGLLSGFEFSSIMFGKWVWIKREGKLERKTLSIAGAGGQCLMRPPEGPPDRRAYLWYNLGGVLANGLLSLICLIVAYNLKPGSFWSTFFWTLGWLGIGLALVNIIPFPGTSIQNDGRNILDIYRSRQALEGLHDSLLMAGCQVQGVRLKDMPDAWFNLPPDLDLKNGVAASRAVYACNRLMDQGAYAQAYKAMAALLEKETAIMPLHRGLLEADLVTCALLLGQADQVDKLMGEAYRTLAKAMKDFPSVIRTQYGLALLRDGDEKEAKKHKDRFESIAKTYPYDADIQSEAQLMEDLLEVFIQMHTGHRQPCP